MLRKDLRALKIPDAPGVYLFLGAGGSILYIGKAASLRDRVRSYFAPDLAAGRGARIVGMVEAAKKLKWFETGSVLEALILEANLIKRHQPPYNVDGKDNTSFNYIVVTKEDFPRVLTMRGRGLFGAGASKRALKDVFGPYPHGLQLKEAMKIVRRIFPYRDDRCEACGSPKNASCKPCFNRQLGLCPGVCTGEISKEEYARVVKHIRELFSGNFKGLKRELARDMKAAAKEERFEEAHRARSQIEALEHIRDVSLIRDESRVSSGGGARIEAYDVAHTAGRETVAVMTVVHNGEKMPAAYRMFKIRSAANNDVAALSEALSRRLTHPEWPLPRVFAVDGATAQVNAARRVLKKAGVETAVVGVVKNEFHKPERLVGDSRSIEAYERDILLANSEAHRFAITWHRRRLRRAML